MLLPITTMITVVHTERMKSAWRKATE